MRTPSRSPCSGLLLAGLLFASLAHAHEDGIIGYSGKNGVFCNACHSGGSTPTVALTGPTTVTANTTNTYVLTITGGAAQAGGLNAAVDVDDAIMGAGPSGELRVQNNEVTHTDEQEFEGPTLALTFTVRAPPRNGPFRIFAAGNSTNDNGENNGDRAGATALSVEVTGGIEPPDAGVPPPPPGGEPAPALEDEPTNGCSATGGPALALALLLLAGAAAHQRSRRRGR